MLPSEHNNKHITASHIEATDNLVELQKANGNGEANFEVSIVHSESHNEQEDKTADGTELEVVQAPDIQDELGNLREENARLRIDLQEARNEIKQLRPKIVKERFDIRKHKCNDKDIEFYTGFRDFEIIMFCYRLIEQSAKNMSYGNHERMNLDQPKHSQVGRPRSLTTFQEFIMVLMRLKLGLFERDLAHRFKVSESSVSVIVRTWLRFLRSEFEPLIKLPPRDVIRFHSSKSFKTLFTNVVVIVDCTEVEMEKPSALNSNSACYSSYKSRPTMKSLLTQTFASSEAK